MAIRLATDQLTSSELLIEEFENVIFPSTDSRIDKIVSIIRGFAHWRINFQEMRPAQLLELLSHDFAGNGGVIVRCMDEHMRLFVLRTAAKRHSRTSDEFFQDAAAA